MRAFGACLVADLFDGKACSSRADCATGAVLPQPMQHVDYCLKGAGEAQSTCWSRGPDMEWCNKAPPPGRVAGSFSTPTVDAANVAGSGQKTRFVTLVCVNAASYPMFSDGPLPPCASADPAAASYRVNVVSAVSRYP